MARVILFDLDGTLVDTAPELADALNDVLQTLGLAPVPEDLVRGWIGDGARALLGKALDHLSGLNGAPDVPVDEARAWALFGVAYEARCGTRSTVFDGVLPLLQRLQAQGSQLAVLTNKEARFAHRVLTSHGLSQAFSLIVAGDSLPVKKPHPQVVQHALDALQASTDEALLVGDSVTDVRCARGAGIPVWLVRHGYPQGLLEGADAPDGFIDHFDDFCPAPAARVAIA